MSAAPERLRGTLSKIRFTSENGEFSVCELDVPDRARPVTLVGNILSARPGESVEVIGTWKDHQKFGRQFEIDEIRVVAPTTSAGIETYLASGLIEGIGPVLAERIVDEFGEETLEIIDEDPTRIREVDGIGAVRGERIARAWEEQRSIRNVMIFLQSHGVSPNYAMKIWKRYENAAISVIRRNPYRLADDIFGIGFRKADEIARHAGIERDAPERKAAGLLYVLKDAHSSGHVYLPRTVLMEKAAELLSLPAAQLGEAVGALVEQERIVVEPADEEHRDDAIYRKPAWHVEVRAAEHLRRLVTSPRRFRPRSVRHQLSEVEERIGITLADAQREAVAAAWTNKVTVITGGPGTGKTTIIRAVCALGRRFKQSVALAAPTGRAAKRLSQATGQGAKTVHRLLEYSFKEGGFQYNEERKLDVDMLIVDEASMIDIYLIEAIAEALPDDAALLLVGDVDQLPSVGPGNVLGDVIDSGVAKVVRLTEIFRQASESGIVVNAHRINQGEMPVAQTRGTEELADFYTIATDEPAVAQQRIVELVTSRIPEAFELDAAREIQVISPMHRGEVGCQQLNAVLQEEFTAGRLELRRGATVWRMGDKVMQTRNNYELEIFNGDIGRIVAIDTAEEVVHVSFEGRRVELGYDDLDELIHAYAITVHKSQGSEYPAVVMPVTTQHYVMLQRNLLYTAVTRAKELVVLVGSEKAMRIALRNNRAQLRYTKLARRLRE